MSVELKWYGEAKKKDITNGMVRFLIRGTNLVQADAKLLVAKKTTDLEKSIVKAVDPKTLIGKVSTNKKYAFAQEFGLRSIPNYTWSPYMRPALDDNKPTLIKMAKDEVITSVNK